MSMKIVELKIDDQELSGVDGIALVEMPAIEEEWYYFNAEENLYIIKDSELGQKIAEELIVKGDSEEDLAEEGWVIVSAKPISGKEDAIKQKELFNFNIQSDPNGGSSWDTLDANTGERYRIRYKYTGPIDSKNRDFCAAMMRANKVYRREDIDNLQNPQFGTYSIFDYRGSYNCRHRWVELKYKTEGRILNKGNVKRGQVGQELLGSKEDTMTNATINNKVMKQKGVFNAITEIDGEPVFSSKEEALMVGMVKGCQGYHEHELPNGQIGYMACSTHTEKKEFESTNDYPQAASDNACKVLRWRDQYGDEVQGMTRVGWTRANQLCKKENISEETIARMSAFQRHRKNAEISEENKGTPWKDAGYVAWLGWGGTEGIEWAARKVQEFDLDVSTLSPYTDEVDGELIVKDDYLYENPCQEGYIAYGTKIKDGREVPNCVKKTTNKKMFSLDDDERMIYSPAMIPNKFIIRRNPITKELYYVFFSKETIKDISQKYLKNKYTDKTNLEHLPIELDNVYVTESWLVEDRENDKSRKFGFDLPEGTWMVGMKVENDKVWSKVKKGELRGLSVEGYFTEKLLFNKDEELLLEINNILKNIKDD